MKIKTIKFVNEEDILEILKIYKYYVEETSITFEYVTPSFEEFKDRIKEISSEYPYIVYLSGNDIIGYAYAHKSGERAAYQWNVELSIYLDKNYLGGGIGKILYSALIEILKLQNIQNAYSRVALPNKKSEKLHENLGFCRVGKYSKTGYKNGKWHDVGLFEKRISDYNIEPKPFTSIGRVNKDSINKILNYYNEMINYK